MFRMTYPKPRTRVRETERKRCDKVVAQGRIHSLPLGNVVGSGMGSVRIPRITTGKCKTRNSGACGSVTDPPRAKGKRPPRRLLYILLYIKTTYPRSTSCGAPKTTYASCGGPKTTFSAHRTRKPLSSYRILGGRGTHTLRN